MKYIHKREELTPMKTGINYRFSRYDMLLVLMLGCFERAYIFRLRVRFKQFKIFMSKRSFITSDIQKPVKCICLNTKRLSSGWALGHYREPAYINVRYGLPTNEGVYRIKTFMGDSLWAEFDDKTKKWTKMGGHVKKFYGGPIVSWQPFLKSISNTAWEKKLGSMSMGLVVHESVAA